MLYPEEHLHGNGEMMTLWAILFGLPSAGTRRSSSAGRQKNGNNVKPQHRSSIIFHECIKIQHVS